METLAHIFRTGGPFMYVNVVVSIIAIAMIIDRVIAIFFKYRINAEAFMRTVIKLVDNNNIDRAVKVCEDYRNAAVARVSRAGLLKANRGEMEISTAVDEELMRCTPMLEKRIASLWAVANIATLIGLLGTITGLIRSFSALASVSPEQKATFLARGISEALNNTAFGLSIAVTCMVGHLILSGASKNMMADLEISAVSLENYLILRQRSGVK